MQDKTLYTGLSASTVSTSVVFLVAALAAKENRYVVTVDIKGAYLNAHMKYDVVVHMDIAKTLFDMLVKLDKSCLNYTCPDGRCIVRLDRALYGCVESASLWYEDTTRTLVKDGHISNKRDVCCFNKFLTQRYFITMNLIKTTYITLVTYVSIFY
jgi:thiamine pyrophosphate-dependent acetolactate synthase large subunit-like protein